MGSSLDDMLAGKTAASLDEYQGPFNEAAARPVRSEVEPHGRASPASKFAPVDYPGADTLVRCLGPGLALSLAMAGCARQHSDPQEPAPFPPSESAPAPLTPSEKQSELDTLEDDLAVSEQRLAGYLAGRSSELRAEISKDQGAPGREEKRTLQVCRSAGAQRSPTVCPPRSRRKRTIGRRTAAGPRRRPHRQRRSRAPVASAIRRARPCLRCGAADRICSIAGESDRAAPVPALASRTPSAVSAAQTALAAERLS